MSVAGVGSEAALDELARGPLQRFQILTVMTAVALRGSRLEVRPTFRRPHYTVMLPDLDQDVNRFLECEK